MSPDGRFLEHKPKPHSLFKAPYKKQPFWKEQDHWKFQESHCHGVSKALQIGTDLQVVIHKDEIIIPDQGSNRVWRMRYSDTGGLRLVGTIDDFLEADGPRHGVVHPNGEQGLEIAAYSQARSSTSSTKSPRGCRCSPCRRRPRRRYLYSACLSSPPPTRRIISQTPCGLRRLHSRATGLSVPIECRRTPKEMPLRSSRQRRMAPWACHYTSGRVSKKSAPCR